MPRPLQVIDPSQSETLLSALDVALRDNGPAVFPYSGQSPLGVPSSVDDNVALVVETSGSTGRPKRVWHTAASLKAAADQVNAELGGPGVWWQVLPGHYIAGIMVSSRAIYSGGFVISRKRDRAISEDVTEFALRADAEAPNLPQFTSLVPKQLAELIDVAMQEPGVAEALSSFSRILVGGQRVPKSLMTAAQDLGLSVTKTYGSAETAGGCVWDGKPLEGTVVNVFDNRISLSGPMLAGGYLGDPERTAKSFVERDNLRWFFSDDGGDISDGRLFVSGRIDRVIISGGEKTNLDEVELALSEEYETTHLAVIAVADPTWGEAIGVISTNHLDPESIGEFLGGQFGPAARLAWFKRVSSLPRLASGKVNRNELEHIFGPLASSAGVQ